MERNNALALTKSMYFEYHIEDGLRLVWAKPDGFVVKSVYLNGMIMDHLWAEREYGTAEVAYWLIMDRWPTAENRDWVRTRLEMQVWIGVPEEAIGEILLDELLEKTT